MHQRVFYDFYKISLTFSDLRKLKSFCLYRIVPSSIKNQVYLDLWGSSFHCRTRNYHINQMIFFLATESMTVDCHKCFPTNSGFCDI